MLLNNYFAFYTHKEKQFATMFYIKQHCYFITLTRTHNWLMVAVLVRFQLICILLLHVHIIKIELYYVLRNYYNFISILLT